MRNMGSYIGDIVFKYLPQGVMGNEPFLGALYYILIDIDDALFEIGEYNYHYVNKDLSGIRIAPIYTPTYLCMPCVFKVNLDVWVGDFSM